MNATANVSSEWQVMDKILYDVETYYLWVILAIGFPGNCATIITVIKMAPGKSLSVYITLLAVADNLAILTKLIIFVLLDHDINIGDGGCKILAYLGNFLVTFANWILVGMSVERFVAVWFPMKFAQKWSFRKSVLVTVLVSVPLLCIFLPLFWVMKITQDQEEGFLFCDIYGKYRYFMTRIWFWINIALFAGVPCVVLIVFNMLIVVGMAKSRKTRRLLKILHQPMQHQSEGNRQVTIMLVTAAIVLVVLTTPRSVMLILTPYWVPQGKSEAMVHYLIDTIAYIMCDSTHAVNFYVYSLSARRFRRYFVDLILCRGKKDGKSSRYSSMSSKTSARSSLRPLNSWESTASKKSSR